MGPLASESCSETSEYACDERACVAFDVPMCEAVHIQYGFRDTRPVPFVGM